ncbi:zinc finger BED domain-containing protein 4-like [Metopolophium dirhodum]|uniref:zinc finger BED domain-containing protein 4-like n=1 Tax=Metopolophium dirhodum TaxID=44670 RepID=UPI00298FDFB7|nr:zinc finger BED domain-containing protein 4-like [Metopolophium dirhodum]
MDDANCDGEFGELESFNEPLQTFNSNKSSLIWGYFENCKELDKAACNHCKQKVYKGIRKKATTSSMRKHLKFKHKTLFDKLLTSEELKKESKAKGSIQTGKRQMSLYESVNKKKCWDMNDAKSKEIHKIIGEMICVDNEPFNLVERSGFNKLMTFVKPQYKMPGRKYFTETVIPEMYIELKTKIMSTLETVAAVSLTSDIWTCSHNNASFISFTSHWISEDFKQHHSTLNIRNFQGRHTGFAIKNCLEELLNEWNLMDKIHLLIR